MKADVFYFEIMEKRLNIVLLLVLLPPETNHIIKIKAKRAGKCTFNCMFMPPAKISISIEEIGDKISFLH